MIYESGNFYKKSLPEKLFQWTSFMLNILFSKHWLTFYSSDNTFYLVVTAKMKKEFLAVPFIQNDTSPELIFSLKHQDKCQI